MKELSRQTTNSRLPSPISASPNYHHKQDAQLGHAHHIIRIVDSFLPATNPGTQEICVSFITQARNLIVLPRKLPHQQLTNRGENNA